MTEAALPYHEPGIVTILIQASFLLLLNTLGSILDDLLYCGLVGQVLIGIAWGTPGARLLSEDFEEIATQIGYLGLIAIVFEGGLSTSVRSIRKNFLLSVCVAVTGVLLPIGLSFSLRVISATNLQAFAAGAALCSTSLGTTFSLLKATGLIKSRLGIVLATAAMLDDVVGLVMVQVIANLGSNLGSFKSATVVRPIFVSFGFAIFVVLMCRYFLKPLMNMTKDKSKVLGTHMFNSILAKPITTFIASTVYLLALMTASSYAGTSILFAAYLAGASISWLEVNSSARDDSSHTPADDSGILQVTPHPREAAAVPPPNSMNPTPIGAQQPGKPASLYHHGAELQVHRSHQEPTPPPENQPKIEPTNTEITVQPAQNAIEQSHSICIYNHYYAAPVEHILKPLFFASIGFSISVSKLFRGPIIWRGIVYAILMIIGKLCCAVWLIRFSSSPPRRAPKKEKKENGRSFPKPKSLYPASILGCAMVARGEIGFLISALAATKGVFDPTDTATETARVESELYLIVTWAILLCTIVGPISLGFLANRVKRLQDERKAAGNQGKEDPLGIWGMR